ncbi:uncharacterized protein V6R79_018884 [Siganus canaliculatus]
MTPGNPNSFLFSFEFCMDSVSKCLSHGADRLCVSIGLYCLSTLLLLLSCFLLVYQWCTFRGESPGNACMCLYSFVGNLCNTVGAFLSRQLHIQVLMGAVAAAVDAVLFFTCFLPLLFCWNSTAERTLRMRRRRRRRQHLLAVCILMVVAGGFLKSEVTSLSVDRPLSRRRLLHVTLQDNIEILGYILGLLSFFIAFTSRFPALCRSCRGQMSTPAYLISGLLCSLAGAFYAAAILLHDTHFGFLLRVLPWLLAAISCAALDLLIVIIHWCCRTRQHPASFSPDTESLLDGVCIPTEDKSVVRMQRKQHIHSSAQTNPKNVQKMSDMGRYMEVSVQPARMICLRELMSKEDEEEEEDEEEQVIAVDSFYSSCTSEDSSLVSSDLEWDFEETNTHWSEPTSKRFPPQGWSRNPEAFNVCTCSTSGCGTGDNRKVCLVQKEE